MNKELTEIELVNHYKNLNVRNHISELIAYDLGNYGFSEMHIEMLMSVFETSSLKPEVFNILVDF